MTEIIIVTLRFLFALILGVATVVTVIMIGPFWLIFWIWKQLTEKKSRR
ncbi:hypothetical protein MUK70_30200 [Dyadobacter chenwenxiniae]|uniref:Uncharacterized protein n=1 Tax=Dyadobacter chenwenxiniae TaxID=2906456 RepID=A0A9X1TGG1_9BACT|nr:hypothetical protein [Dyadobacter chenwenxiniae]MCF0052253.1 hypothetical protein [Dyadobacter chenwenxiniae]MCF0063594.1 hypothetical protein [Dyadobacter chenwenxiniae]UON83270.1 hypothetical protein MUK70_30200 [Dyadobacter chenwenxiniae]